MGLTRVLLFITYLLCAEASREALLDQTHQHETELLQSFVQNEALDVESVQRLPREIKFSFPGQDKIPRPPIALCFREPCKVPGGFRGPTFGGRFRRSPIEENLLHDTESLKSLAQDEALDVEPIQRFPREIKFSFPGQDKIPRPPTALCFREPCKVPGGFRGPTFGGRFRRSPIEENLLHDTKSLKSLAQDEALDVEPIQRFPREIKFSFPGQDKFPRPPTALCFREPCNVPGGFRGPTFGGRFRRSPIEKNLLHDTKSLKSLAQDEALDVEPIQRFPREIKFSFPGQDKFPRPPTALCFREPCRVPGSIQRPVYGGQRFRRSIIEENPLDTELLKSFTQDEVLGAESAQRLPREIKFSFPEQGRIPHRPTAICNREPCEIPGSVRGPIYGGGRFRRSIEEPRERRAVLNDNESNTRGSIYSTKSFGPNSHGGWQSTAQVEHDLWKSKDGTGGVTTYGRHDRIDGERFNSFKDSKYGLGYEKRFRRAAENFNTRGSIYSTKSFGPNSHGGWQSTAKVEHDIWKSKDGTGRVTAYGRHDRIDGGRFDGFKDSKVGVGYEKRFRRAAEDFNTRGSIYSTKSFGPNSHGGWQSTAKVEHDIWKSKDGTGRVTAYGRHDRIDGGRFDGFKDSKVGVGYEKRFRRAADDNTTGNNYLTGSLSQNNVNERLSIADVKHEQ